jgi:hypothetical protein
LRLQIRRISPTVFDNYITNEAFQARFLMLASRK